MTNMRVGLAVLPLSILMLATSALADNLPKGFVVVPQSVSPNGKLQVAVPAMSDAAQPRCQTLLLDVSTGKTVAEIKGECFFLPQNQVQFHPHWDKDGTALIWQSDNKWGSANVQLLQLKDDAVVKQRDLRAPAVKRALAHAKKLAPKQYAISKKHGQGSGDWFRDGFAIDVQPVVGSEGVTWPLNISIDLTSDHKCDQPASSRVGGTMQATVTADGKWSFAAPVQGHAACGKDGLTCAFSDCE